MSKKKKKTKQSKNNPLAKSMNLIRSQMNNEDIANVLGVSKDTVRNIANGKSLSNEQTRQNIHYLENQVKAHIEQKRAEYLHASKDKNLSSMQRSLARSKAKDYQKTDYTSSEATKRQKVFKEQVLPHIKASEFLAYYAEGKTEVQRTNELKRFSHNGKELLVTNFHGNVFFSRKPLYKTSRVHPRGIVYLNSFNAGINQVVRDLNYLYENNLTLIEAIEEGLYYFGRCFFGPNKLQVNKAFMDRGIVKPKGSKTKTKGEKYEDMSKWLSQRLFLGIYLY